jgi:LPXTG-motif cell wall-anchored protein
VTLHGQVSAPAQLTGLPANAATGDVTFPAKGTGVIEAPAKTLTLVPLKGATALPSISCTTTAATQNVSVTVDPPMTGTSGPLYTCKVTMGTATATVIAAIPMTITASGSRTTGKTDTVTLASAALGAPYPQGTTSVSFAGDLPVNGAQSGKTALAKTTTDVTSATFRVSGNLLLTKPGTTHILVPEKFTFTDSMKASPTAAVVTMTLVCTIKTSPTPVGLTAHVTGAPINPASSSGSASGGGQGGQAEGTGIPLGVSVPASGGSGTGGSGTGGSGTGSGTPAGAPSTGGGTGPASDPALAVAGLALVLAGGGLVFLASQRRRRQAG